MLTSSSGITRPFSPSPFVLFSLPPLPSTPPLVRSKHPTSACHSSTTFCADSFAAARLWTPIPSAKRSNAASYVRARLFACAPTKARSSFSRCVAKLSASRATSERSRTLRARSSSPAAALPVSVIVRSISAASVLMSCMIVRKRSRLDCCTRCAARRSFKSTTTRCSTSASTSLVSATSSARLWVA